MKSLSFLAPLGRVSLRHLSADVTIMLISFYGALYLRLGPETFLVHTKDLHWLLPVVVLVRVASMIAFQCYSVMWRYISTIDATRLAQSLAVSTAAIVALSFFTAGGGRSHLPKSVYIIDAILTMLGLMGIRLFRRLIYEGQANRKSQVGKRTLIYGAGQNGRHLAHRFKSDAGLNTNVVGYIDDDSKKADIVINGVPVLGSGKVLAQVIESFRISQVIVAIPQLSGDFLRNLVAATRPYNIRPRVTTRMGQEPGDGRQQLEIVRDLNLADLLNHPPREIDLKPVAELVRGKCVLVTGAGGSIGSELARQIMSYEPSRLILLDHSEYNLYEIDRELRLATHDTQRVVPLMIDLKDENSLRLAMKQYVPDVVFHAAAYKHVHLVETNPFSSILNNVGSTRNLLTCCEEIKVKNFVMVSTDKAVNPAGIMGSTKRVCELLVTASALKTGFNYCSVRFGNVLGSSGSLIPLLKQQIEQGGPVTITDPEMTRFFMLIPEAVSLVLKASTISRPGDITILKMGDPIRILDVAKSLITLLGKSEDEIQIVFTGLRPGEKMFEELYIRGDEIQTEHPDILTLRNGDSTLAAGSAELQILPQKISALITHAEAGSNEAIFDLNDLVRSNYEQNSAAKKDQGAVIYIPRPH
jgi:FlaA1/EpsC-like NDP-sugar epimerase